MGEPEVLWLFGISTALIPIYVEYDTRSAAPWLNTKTKTYTKGQQGLNYLGYFELSGGTNDKQYCNFTRC